MAIHSSILAWRIPWREEPGGLLPIGSQRGRHDWSDLKHTHTHTHPQSFVYEFLHEHKCSFLWDKCLRVQYLDVMVSPFLVFRWTGEALFERDNDTRTALDIRGGGWGQSSTGDDRHFLPGGQCQRGPRAYWEGGAEKKLSRVGQSTPQVWERGG